MKGGWIVAGIILIILGVALLFTIICIPIGVLLGVIGFIMILYGLVASDDPIQQTVYVQQYQPPQYQQMYYQPQYQPQYQMQHQPQYPPPAQPQSLPQYPRQQPLPAPAAEPLAEVEWRICPKCGVENLPEMTFCGRCGERLAEEAVTHR